MALRTEIQEFVDEVGGKLHPGEPWTKQVHHVVREGGDVIGALLQAGANPEELSNDIIAAANQLLPKLNLGPIAKRIAGPAIAYIVPELVDLAKPYIGRGQDFVNEQIVPRLDDWIETLQDIRSDLSPGVIP